MIWFSPLMVISASPRQFTAGAALPFVTLPFELKTRTASSKVTLAPALIVTLIATPGCNVPVSTSPSDIVMSAVLFARSHLVASALASVINTANVKIRNRFIVC